MKNMLKTGPLFKKDLSKLHLIKLINYFVKISLSRQKSSSTYFLLIEYFAFNLHFSQR